MKIPKKEFIFLLTLACLIFFFASFFNMQSGVYVEDSNPQFYLIGPDSYYNLHLTEKAMNSGIERLVDHKDTLLNYPLGTTKGRPPLFNMIAIGSTTIVQTVTSMDTQQALGWSILFLPVLYGALLVFPVYGIGKELFDKHVGLFSSLFIVLIPLHIIPAHGCTLGLFDHDSFVLLLFMTTIYFVIKSLQGNTKYSIISALPLSLLYYTWVSAYSIGFLISLFSLVLLCKQILTNDLDIKPFQLISTILWMTFILTIPYLLTDSIGTGDKSYIFIPCILSLIPFIFILLREKFFASYYQLKQILGASFIASLVLLFLSIFDIIRISFIQSILSTLTQGIYGSDIYSTIAEGQIMGLSQISLTFSPIIYLFGLLGMALFFYVLWKINFRYAPLFFALSLIFTLWLTTQAGRFNNMLVPFIAILAAYFTLRLLETLSCLTRHKKIIYKTCIILIPIMLVAPSGYLLAQASIPPALDETVFGGTGLWGHDMQQEQRWSYAMYWLENYDKPGENNKQLPAVISWWDYGFYIVTLSHHPTVADNFQNGIIPAAFFLTAQTEEEATAVLTLRLLEPYKNHMDFPELHDILQLPEIEMYQQGIPFLLNNMSSNIYQIYDQVQQSTNTSIGFSAVTYRDLYDIYIVFPMFAEKNISQFLETKYVDVATNTSYTKDQVNALPHEQYITMTFDIEIEYKESFYNSMAYRLFNNDNLSHWNQIYNKNNIVLSEYI